MTEFGKKEKVDGRRERLLNSKVVPAVVISVGTYVFVKTKLSLDRNDFTIIKIKIYLT